MTRKDGGQPQEEAPRHGSKPIFVLLAISIVVGGGVMFYFGLRGLSMPDEIRMFNKLLREQTLACVEPMDVAKCRAATKAVADFNSREIRLRKGEKGAPESKAP